MVCCDERGLVTFQLLRQAERAPGVPSTVFDPPGAERDELPARVYRGLQGDAGKHTAQELGHGVRLIEHMEHPNGAVVLQHACKIGPDGIVPKRLGSRYGSGRSPDWLKFKNPAAPAVEREAEEGEMREGGD